MSAGILTMAKRKMGYLIQGCESLEKIDILLSMTSIRGEHKIKSLHRYYVDGWSRDLIKSSGMDMSNFDTCNTTLNVVAGKYTRLCEIEGLVKKSVN